MIPLSRSYRRTVLGWLAERHLLAWVVLLAGLTLTLVLWLASGYMVRDSLAERFRFREAEVVHALRDRLQAYEQVLHGARGLLRAADPVTRRQWQTYVGSLDLGRRYPGIQGVGYARWTPPDEVAALEERVRAEGVEDFRVWPDTPRSEYAPIIFLEPMDARNRRAIGYDMWTEPTRHAAMSLARDTGSLAITGRVRLVQETQNGGDAQPGFLMYLPFYGPPLPVTSIEARRRQLRGFVYAPFRVNDFIAPAAGGLLDDVRLRIYAENGADGSAELLFDSLGGAGEAGGGAITGRLSSTVRLNLPGTAWVLRLDALPGFSDDGDLWLPPTILVLGGAFSLLGAAVARNATGLRREQARAAALGRIIDEATTEVYVLNARTLRVVEANRGARANLGYSAADLSRLRLPDLQPQMDITRIREVTRSLRHGTAAQQTYETLHRRADGSSYEAQVTLQYHRDAVPPLYHAVVQDVTSRKRQEAALTKALMDAQTLLAEKETLLREVHHRVKNNLQVIWSLIRLEAADIEDARVRGRLEVVARRIGVLGQIHQQLYGSDNLARVDIGEQVRKLGESLAELHAHQDVRIDVGAENVTCDLEQAIPLGLIANELISNSLEHGFPGGRVGRVEVAVAMRDGHVTLEVRDDGIGMGSGGPPRSGLGLRLIEALAGQLGARLDVGPAPGGGTRTTVTLPCMDSCAA